MRIKKVSSISSARKGWPKHSRDENYVAVSTDFEPVINYWKCIENVGPEQDEYRLEISCLAGEETGTWGYEPYVCLNQFRVFDGNISRGPDGVNVYKMALTSASAEKVILLRTVIIDDADAQVPIDLLACRQASDKEIQQALSWEPTPEPDEEPQPAPPSYKRIERTECDSASRLGFQVGRSERQIRTSRGWSVVGINLPVAQIVGKIELSILRGGLEIALFTATGEKLIHVDKFVGNIARFDEVRIPAGDILVAFKGSAEGSGSYGYPNSLVFIGELEEKPNLDAILAGPRADGPDFKCGVPEIRFSAA